ncbi:MAG: ABC transporter permease [Ktedonobacteraceae bacterium]|nr:ABC transporter permease [Ktedonobacteraceae bacterium]
MSRLLQPRARHTVPTQSGAPATSPAQNTPLASLLQSLNNHRYRRSAIGMMGSNFASALEALAANRLRSFLTTLGIFIGIAAVIAALTLTQGVSAYINNLIGVSANTIIIFPGAARVGGASQGMGSGSTLTANDAQSLARLPHVVNISPVLTSADRVIYSNQNWTTTVEGVNTSFQYIQNWQLASGSWFSDNDDLTGAPVAVLGDTVYHNLFDASGNNPIGQQIRIRNEIFRVVGVLAPQGGALTQDDVVFVPFKAMHTRLHNTPYISTIFAQTDSAENLDSTVSAMSNVLRKNHRLPTSAQNDFQTITSTEIQQQVNQSMAVLEVLLIGIAAISLTVGGIGIMNIMLVSITERTWEIGIRMAIGARRSDIRNQFLIEALVLCLIGGLIGLILGLLIGRLVVSLSGLPFIITPLSIILPFAVSSVIALVFGLYPAIRASRLDPITAIRTEE